MHDFSMKRSKRLLGIVHKDVKNEVYTQEGCQGMAQG